MKKRNKLKLSYFITLFSGVALAYFLWLSWSKLTEFIGNSNIVWGITGLIVVLSIFFGYFSFDKVSKRFT